MTSVTSGEIDTSESNDVEKHKLNSVNESNYEGELDYANELNQAGELDQANELNQAGELDQANELNQAGELDQANELNQAGELDQADELNQGSEPNYVSEIVPGSKSDHVNETCQIIYYEYGSNGQLIRETNPLGDSRSYTYTSLGKIATVTDEAGLVTTYDYEKGGRLKTVVHPNNTKESYTYDKVGNIKIHTIPTGLTQEFIYDSLNRVIQIRGLGGETKSYTYDAVSNVTSMTDELGNTTYYEYSLTGKLTKVTDALGNLAIYTYDERDQLIEVKQLGSEILTADQDLEQIIKQNAENQTLHITKYERDMMGRITTITDALGQKESFKYNVKGQLYEKLDKDGYLTKYGYTTHGDVSHIQYADGKEVKMRYNVLRQLTEVTDWLGTTKIMVDALGRATKVTNHQNKTVDYTWGVAGEKRTLTYPEGNTVIYDYDEFLRLSEVDDGKTKVSYRYDECNRLVEKAFQSGVKTNYRYDTVGRLAELSHYKQEELLDKFAYEYDMAGNKIKIVKERKDFSEDTGFFAYSYDPLNRLHEVKQDGNTLRTYNYDGYGNRATLHARESTTSYSYNALNQLVSTADVRDGQEKHQTYTYDKRGNLTEIFKNHQLTHQYYFGALNRLESVYNHEKQLGAVYQYNGLGHRVGKTEGQTLESIQPTIILNNLNLKPTKQVDDVIDLTRQYHNLLERNENQSNTSFTWDFSVLTANSMDGDRHNSCHYLQDDLGSPVRLANQMGVEQEIYGFDEFGQSILNNNKMYRHQPFTYTGYQTDEVSETYYAQAREYQPITSRMISEDPYWNRHNGIYGGNCIFSNGVLVPDNHVIMQSTNKYSYAMGNPLRFIDSSGLWCKELHESMTRDVMEELGELHPELALLFDSQVDAIVRGNLVIDGWNYAAVWRAHCMITQGRHFDRSRFDEDRWPNVDSRVCWGNYYMERAIEIWLAADEAYLRFQEELESVLLIPFLSPTRTSELAAPFRDAKRERASYYLGRGLHSIQDIEAHGNIGTNNPFFAEHITRRADDPDFDWRNENRWTLRRSEEQLRFNISIDDTREYLIRFYESVGVL